MRISQNNNYYPNFKALPVADINSAQGKITLLQINKHSDKQFMQNLLNSFLDGNIRERFPNSLTEAMKIFLNNAFASINKAGTKGVLSFKDGVPTGLISYSVNKSINEIYIDYLASWVPQNIQKIKNNGKMLVSHVYQEALDLGISSVTLTPGFMSVPFYKKLGFNINTKNACINIEEIKKQFTKLNKEFHYIKKTDERNINLPKTLKE